MGKDDSGNTLLRHGGGGEDLHPLPDPNDLAEMALSYKAESDIATENKIKQISCLLNEISFNIDMRFNEMEHIINFIRYIVGTYNQHYASDKIQAFEIIEDCGHGLGFSLGNILKYTKRVGKKDGENFEKEINKVIHYAFLSLFANEEKTK